ncbi:carbohydrate ABC transporter permease [Streptomyces aidingensis]|uniref:Multiple sugar transport system permease protein n=1 Tax=Streptomyces aidingensis TaxID=910347 RepID=A0A1I1MPL5_9ACTN|nr:carbohydrate ABC transporter permease [Streptomyces aidingensis]SFC84553.1 multiple sugar transport system permease protein [Streptomyces aidingensis]
MSAATHSSTAAGSPAARRGDSTERGTGSAAVRGPAPAGGPDAARRSRRRARARGTGRTVLYHGFILAVGFVILYPGAWMVLSAFRPSNEIVGQVGLIPDDTTLDNFTTAFSGIGGISFWTFFGNSLFLAVGAVVGICLSSTFTAYAFARIDFPGKGLWFSLMIATLLLPFHVVIIPQYIMFNELGLVDTFWPLLLGKFLAAEAFFVFLMVQFMRNLPRELDESARIDGAGHLRIYWSIMLPLMRPVMVTASIFAFIWSWNDFFGPLIYLKSPENYTMPLALRQYVDQTTVSDYGGQMAMAVLALVPVLLFFIVFQRYIVDGVATSGLKG